MSIDVGNTVIQEMVDELVVRGADDWVMLSEVDRLVATNAARHGFDLSESARITVGLEVIRAAIERGLTDTGDVSESPPGFVPWSVPLPVAIERIGREWRATGELKMGDVCWFANTNDGDAYAAKVVTSVDARRDWR
jgi:hypothetical protein